MGIYDVEGSKVTAKLKKSYLVNADKKTEKLKKCYVVGSDKKLVKLWSGFTPRFIGANHNQIFKSVDGVTWEATDVPWGNSYKSYYKGGEISIGMTYGLGKYWIANSKYLCSSEDGDTWTVEKIHNNVNTSTDHGYNKVFFVNGHICAYDSYSRTLHITSDGKTWTTRSCSSYPWYLKELLYGEVDGTAYYFWLFVVNSDTNNRRIYRSTSLTGELTAICSYDTSYSRVKELTMGICDGRLFATDYDTSDSEYDLCFGKGSSIGSAYEHHTYPFVFGTTGKGTLMAFTFNYSIYAVKVSDSGSIDVQKSSSSNFTTNAIYYNLHPPYSPEGTVAFPLNFNGTNGAIYKRASDSAYTKVTGVGTPTNGLDPYVAVYGVDGGGYYTT